MFRRCQITIQLQDFLSVIQDTIQLLGKKFTNRMVWMVS